MDAWSTFLIQLVDAWSTLFIQLVDAYSALSRSTKRCIFYWSTLLIQLSDAWSTLLFQISDAWSTLLVQIINAWSILLIQIIDEWSSRLFKLMVHLGILSLVRILFCMRCCVYLAALLSKLTLQQSWVQSQHPLRHSGTWGERKIEEEKMSSYSEPWPKGSAEQYSC
jgi:hypothetical protein